MLIVADENIPFAQTLFPSLGEVRTMAGRAITPEAVRDAGMLMVRSVTRVDRALLGESRVRFVGTATIGTDHIDLDWLAERGIGFASAPGSNAESVAQYVAAALACCAGRLGRRLSECSLGIVGVGHCGGRVERIARALGLEVRLCDPPLARQSGLEKYRPLDELLDCDFLTLHVPLTRHGEDPTWRLVDGALMDRISPRTVIVNASRGEVVDEPALEERLAAGRLAGAVLDAWAGEPRIRLSLLRRALLGTPHIAGYSYDGKVAGARMIYEAACRHLSAPIRAPELPLPPPPVGRIELSAAHRILDSVLAELVQTAYPIARDGADLLACAAEDADTMASAFDRCRKSYPLRREFAATQVRLSDAPPEASQRIRELGFTVIA